MSMSLNTRSVLAAGAFSLAAAMAPSGARAQVTINIGQITCAQFVKYSVADPDRIAIWMNGYQHGKRGDVTMEPQELKEDIETLRSACYRGENADQPVMQVVEKLFFSKKN